MLDNFLESKEDTIDMTDSKFGVLSSKQVSKYMKKIIRDVNVDSKVTTNVRILLNQFEWNQQKALDMLYGNAATNEDLNQINSSDLVKVETSFDCSICFENHADHMFSLNCGHICCHSCWTFYITVKITDQDSMIACPGSSSCPTIIKDESIFEFMDKQDIKTKYQQLIIKSFIQSNPMLKWCPGPDCNYVLQIQQTSDDQAIQVQCICGYEFCFQCSQPFHDPAILSCDLMEKWLSNLPTTAENDSKTIAYFQKNVKHCPKCFIPIEKSGGCNYMKCSNAACKTVFCYKCLMPLRKWELCNCKWGFNFLFSGSGENIRNEELASSTAVTYFLMPKNKYLDHEMSMNLEKKWLKNVNLENYLEKKILKTLLKSRQTLINTYVFSYFYISPFFENQLTNLEIVTDKLSHLVKSDLEQNFTLIKITSEECEKLRNELSGHIEVGHKNNWWIKKEQPKNVMKFDIAENEWLELLIILIFFLLLVNWGYLRKICLEWSLGIDLLLLDLYFYFCH